MTSHHFLRGANPKDVAVSKASLKITIPWHWATGGIVNHISDPLRNQVNSHRCFVYTELTIRN